MSYSMLAALGARARGGVPAAGALVVRTRSGALQGELSGDVGVFRGVPFAAPPVGALRFRAPQPAAPWSGVRDATQFAAAATQPREPTLPQSEDCLYLNVWTPGVQRSCPVFVWIHGGGFTGGSSFDPLQDGSRFAAQGIVCVTVAYRLGVFGFLDMEEVLGVEYAGSANNGMRDIMQALRWLQENIAAFGGDPKRVTIGGESAGAKLIDMLMGVPSAGPLFQQMISESGGAERVWPREVAQQVARGFGAQWTASSGQAVAGLKTAAPQAILAAQDRFIESWPAHFPLRVETGDALLPRWPLEAIAGGATRTKRLLLGTNRDESALFVGLHPAADPSAKDLGNLPLAAFAQVEARYRGLYPEMSDEARRIRSLTAEEYWIPSLRVADAHVGAGGTAFVYRFDHALQGGPMAGLAFHSLELSFVWDRFTRIVPSPADTQLAMTVHEAWCSFIRGEEPHATGLPAWPRYNASTRPTMMLDTVSRVEERPASAEFHAWDGLLTR